MVERPSGFERATYLSRRTRNNHYYARPPVRRDSSQIMRISGTVCFLSFFTPSYTERVTTLRCLRLKSSPECWRLYTGRAGQRVTEDCLRLWILFLVNYCGFEWWCRVLRHKFGREKSKLLHKLLRLRKIARRTSPRCNVDASLTCWHSMT